jgi:hypothetical protein
MALPNLTLRSVKGGNLTAEEFDNNHQRHEQRIDEVEANPTVVSPTNVTEAAGVLTFHFSNNDSFPVAVPNPAPASPVVTVADSVYTFALEHANRYLRFTNESGCGVIVPDNASTAIPVGTEFHAIQAGPQPVSFVGDGLAEINHDVAMSPQTRAQFAVVTIKKVDTDEWDLFGALAEFVEEETS